MEIALLNQRITIQQESSKSDDVGNHNNEWSDFYNCAATISGESGSVSQADGQFLAPSDISFTIRSCKRAACVAPLSHRVLFKGNAYEITAVDHQSYKGEWIKLICKKERL